MARCREPGRTREQGRGPRRVRGLSVTEAPTERALQLQHSARRPPPPPPQPPAADPLDLLDGEPVAAQVLHGVYVIVAEEAQADLAERAGRHRLCHSHLRGRGVRRAAHPHTPGNLLLRHSARLAGREGPQQVGQAGPGVPDEAGVVGCPLPAAQLLQPPPLSAVAGVVREGSQERLWPRSQQVTTCSAVGRSIRTPGRCPPGMCPILKKKGVWPAGVWPGKGHFVSYLL